MRSRISSQNFLQLISNIINRPLSTHLDKFESPSNFKYSHSGRINIFHLKSFHPIFVLGRINPNKSEWNSTVLRIKFLFENFELINLFFTQFFILESHNTKSFLMSSANILHALLSHFWNWLEQPRLFFLISTSIFWYKLLRKNIQKFKKFFKFEISLKLKWFLDFIFCHNESGKSFNIKVVYYISLFFVYESKIQFFIKRIR